MKKRIFVTFILGTLILSNGKFVYGQDEQPTETIVESPTYSKPDTNDNTEEKVGSINIDNENVDFNLTGGFVADTTLTVGVYSNSSNPVVTDLRSRYKFVAPINLMLNKKPESPSMLLNINVDGKYAGEDYELIMVNSAVGSGDDTINQGIVDENGNITVPINSVTPIILALDKNKTENTVVTDTVSPNEVSPSTVAPTVTTDNKGDEEKEAVTKSPEKTVEQNEENKPKETKAPIKNIKNKEPKKDEIKKEIKSNNLKGERAKTEDNTKIFLYISLLGASLLGMFLMAFKKS